jgi:hypothetical protein
MFLKARHLLPVKLITVGNQLPYSRDMTLISSFCLPNMIFFNSTGKCKMETLGQKFQVYQRMKQNAHSNEFASEKYLSGTALPDYN